MDPVEPLIVDLLTDLRDGPRPVREVLDVWRTSCPRLPVWEEAESRGLIGRERDLAGGRECVGLTVRGRELLEGGPRPGGPAPGGAALVEAP